jgi:O-succinylbenzoic acid--CoA ligase
MKQTITRADFAHMLEGRPHHETRPMVVEAGEGEVWADQFAHAVAGQGPVFLANPDWGEREQNQFAELLKVAPEEFSSEHGWLLVPTGGSSGEMKLARHDQATLAAAAGGFLRHFGFSCVHSLGTLPRHHVGGLMAWLRSVFTGGTWLEASWRRLAEGGFPVLPEENMIVSLVPAQLARLREEEGGAAWLRQFALVLIGGAALDSGVAGWAREEGVRLVPSYGSTETGAMAAALLPDEFLSGAGGVGHALPHLESQVGTEGILSWRGSSLFQGYWPNSERRETWWNSGDLAEYDDVGRLHILGRADALINSGGEKINPAEVEEVLRALVGSEQLLVLGMPDARWGERVVVAHADEVMLDLDGLWAAANGQIARFKWPKQAVVVAPWPVSPMGKVDRRRIKTAVATALNQPE